MFQNIKSWKPYHNFTDAAYAAFSFELGFCQNFLKPEGQNEFGKHFYSIRHLTCDINWHPNSCWMDISVNISFHIYLFKYRLYIILLSIYTWCKRLNMYVLYFENVPEQELNEHKFQRHFQLENTHVVKPVLHMYYSGHLSWLHTFDWLILAFLYCECLNGVKYIIPLFCYKKKP
jgi:hypothetical protein